MMVDSEEEVDRSTYTSRGGQLIMFGYLRK